MADKLYALKRNDGGVSILYYQATDGAIEDLIAKISESTPVERYIEIQSDVIPMDEAYWNAWVLNDANTIDIDMVKAKTIRMSQLQVIRDAKLAQCNIDFMTALAAQNQTDITNIGNLITQLRGLESTFTMSDITTLDQLKAAIPDYLAS